MRPIPFEDKAMVEIFWNTALRWTRRAGYEAHTEAANRDPLDHPSIARMSLREIADLPLAAPRSADAGIRPCVAGC